MSAPCKRIAMWSGPRNISTAMMRAFENRADCAVIDEPLYAAYLHSTGLAHPARDRVLKSQNADWRVVVAALTDDAPAPVYYQKHMTQHLLPAINLSFTESLLNCFLIREPRRIIASYARVRASFALEELGFSQQKRLFDRECERLGKAPPVLDSALVLQNPKAVLARLCQRLALPFDRAMLRWPAGPRASDGVWAPYWYAAVWQSTGFDTPRRETAAQVEAVLTAEQERLRERADEYYRAMRAHALRA